MAKMTTQRAVRHVLVSEQMSKYRLAQILELSGAIMIDHYLKDTHMSKITADKFYKQFGIEISDVYNPVKLPEEE